MTEPNTEDLLGKITDLEARIAFQEAAIDTLSDTLFAQQQETARLSLLVEHLNTKARELSERLPDESADEAPPPHY